MASFDAVTRIARVVYAVVVGEELVETPPDAVDRDDVADVALAAEVGGGGRPCLRAGAPADGVVRAFVLEVGAGELARRGALFRALVVSGGCDARPVLSGLVGVSVREPRPSASGRRPSPPQGDDLSRPHDGGGGPAGSDRVGGTSLSVAVTKVPAHRRRWGGGHGVVGLWLLTRALCVVALATVEHLVVGDVAYYWRSISALGPTGLPLTLREYPTPVVWLLTVPQLAGGGGRGGYVVAFAATMLLLDAGLTYALWRGASRHHDIAIDFWIAYPVLVGPLSYARFDMLPAVLVGWALLAARTRPWLTGALTGLGAAVKLWPALLAGAFAARRRGRGMMIGAFGVVGFALAAASLAVGGRARLLSPLTWQSDRGLQIESVWATPLMVARLTDPAQWRIRYSAFKAYQLTGPGVTEWLQVSTVATVVGLVLTSVLFVRGLRCRRPTSVGLGLLALATVSITVLTNKTLSPQYLLWLGGPAAALLLFRGDQGDRWRRRVNGLGVVLLVVAALTQLTFPVFYQGLLGRRGASAQLLATAVFTLRNAGVVVITLLVCAWTWAALRRPRQRDAQPGCPDGETADGGSGST